MNTHKFVLFLMLATAIWATVGVNSTAKTDGYALSWWTLDSGGDRSTGGFYILTGTIGQPDTGKVSGGGYILSGGFWAGSILKIYLPLVIR